jgi:hypothetical protein
MRVPRQGPWGRRKASSGPSDAHRDAVRAAREEADSVARRERTERRSSQGEDWQTRLKGSALETRRRLRPAGRGLRAFLGRIAPPITRGLLALVRLPVVLVLALLEAATAAVGWIRPRLRSLASGFGSLVVRYVTPVNTVAFVCLVAAVSLGVSQFMDYRGVAVGADLYEGEVGTVAPAPLRDVETAGSAHLFALLPVAAAVVVLTLMAARGRWGLGRIIGGLGLLAMLVTLAIDLPTGLEGGTSGGAYASSDVELLDGFWIQLFTAAVIALCGFLLARYAREEREEAPPLIPTATFGVERSVFDPSGRDQPSSGGTAGRRPPWEAST